MKKIAKGKWDLGRFRVQRRRDREQSWEIFEVLPDGRLGPAPLSLAPHCETLYEAKSAIENYMRIHSGP